MDAIPNPVTIVLTFVLLSLTPFFIVLTTSFLKISIVFSLIRNALGIQQVPSNLTINSLALILTLYIMAPVLQSTYQVFEQRNLRTASAENIIDSLDELSTPFRNFLIKHKGNKESQFFIRTATKLWPETLHEDISPDSFIILIPSFAINQLTSAFRIAFVIYLPFIAIDLIISNILLAMGMVMVSPMTISLPFKLFLFVVINGWSNLVENLILSYR